jgi:hypothetical protein
MSYGTSVEACAVYSQFSPPANFTMAVSHTQPAWPTFEYKIEDKVVDDIQARITKATFFLTTK